MEITKSIFREYDIRGIYPEEINEDIINQIAKAISIKCINEDISEICIGRDGRLSGESLLDSLSISLSNFGINVVNIGLTSTPLLYFAAKKNKYKSGVMITGSHNPKNYNGVKLIINDKPVSGREIYELISEDEPRTEKTGEIIYKDIKKEYIQEVKENIVINNKIKVVLDCGNGAAGCIAPELFKNIGCEVIELFSDVDGNFPNHHPDPGNIENLNDLISKVKESGADLGLAFDGDGDRVGLVTNKGKVIFPDKIMMILSKHILSSKKGSIIFDVKCSNALPDIIKRNGGKPIMSPTGHFHIKNCIKEHNPLLAGEMSGHIFFNDRWYGFDDGLYAGARLLEILSNFDNPSNVLEALSKGFSTSELNIELKEGEQHKVIKSLQKEAKFLNANEVIKIDGLRVEYDYGFGLMRASNTTPAIVLRFEANSNENLIIIQNEFKIILQKYISLEKIPF